MNKADPDARVSGGIHFTPQPSFVTVASANNAKATRSAHSRTQSTVGDNIHWSEEKWMLITKQFVQTRRNAQHIRAPSFR